MASSFEQEKAINWILNMYKKKLEDDLLKKTSPIDTPPQQPEAMHSKIEDDFYFVGSLTTAALIDTGCASFSIG